jgi:hypothetical protein
MQSKAVLQEANCNAAGCAPAFSIVHASQPHLRTQSCRALRIHDRRHSALASEMGTQQRVLCPTGYDTLHHMWCKGQGDGMTTHWVSASTQEGGPGLGGSDLKKHQYRAGPT